MIPRLTRPIFKHWSEIPLSIGLVLFIIFCVMDCHRSWVIIQHCGGLLESIHDFCSVD